MIGLFCVFEWVDKPVDGFHWSLVGTVRQENDWTGEWLRPLNLLTHRIRTGTNDYDWIDGRLVLKWEAGEVSMHSFRPPDRPKWLTEWVTHSLCHRLGEWWSALEGGFDLIKQVRKLAGDEGAK